jgi:D-amino-acid dehydrogenase
MSDPSTIVVGAGIVGTCVARALQRAGRRVTLVDAEAPGNGTSFGNAGYIAYNYVRPMARGEVVAKVPSMLLDPDAPLNIRWRSLPAVTPWLLRFLAATRPAQVERGSRALAALSRDTNAAWRVEQQASGLGELFRSRGCLYVYTTDAGFRDGAHERELEAANGVRLEILDGDGARRLAPGLSPEVRHGVYIPEGMHTLDPHRTVTTLAERFAAEGGRIERARVTGFASGDGRVGTVQTTGGDLAADAVVIAAGRASRELTPMLGFRAPLVAERGYHVMLEPDGLAFDMPVTWAERGFYLTPMREGLRLAGTVEFATPEAPPTWHRADLLERQARRIVPGLRGKEKSRWMGMRPTLPDYVPAIGRAPHHANVYCAYGHQHVGLTFAAITARHIATLMDGGSLPPDLAACDPGRFG